MSFFSMLKISMTKRRRVLLSILLVNPDLLKTFCKVAQILFLIFLLQSVPFSIQFCHLPLGVPSDVKLCHVSAAACVLPQSLCSLGQPFKGHRPSAESSMPPGSVSRSTNANPCRHPRNLRPVLVQAFCFCFDSYTIPTLPPRTLCHALRQ